MKRKVELSFFVALVIVFLAIQMVCAISNIAKTANLSTKGSYADNKERCPLCMINQNDAQNVVKTSLGDSLLAPQKLVSIPFDFDRFYLSKEEETSVLQKCVSVFEHGNRHDLIAKWRNATLGCVFLEYNALQRDSMGGKCAK